MNRAHLLAAAVAVLLLVPAGTLAEVTGQPNLSVSVANNRVEPGEETTLELVLLNEGTVFSGSNRNPQLEQRVTTARGVSVSLRAGSAPVEVKTGTRAVGNVPEGSSPELPFRIVVDEDAEPGRYTLPVRVRYTYTRFIGEAEDQGQEDRHYEEGVWERLEVTIRVEERPRFEVVEVESQVAVGDTGPVTVSVRNRGSAVAREAQLRLESRNSDLAFGEGAATAQTFAGSWEPGATRTFTYRATVSPEAVEQSYAVDGVVEYTDADGQRTESDQLAFGIGPQAERQFAVEDVRSTLRVGEEGTLRGEVVNRGERTARNAVVVLQERGLRNANPRETSVAVDDLAPGERAEFAFRIAVSESAVAGPRQYEAVVEYRNPVDDQRRSDPLDLRASVAGKRKEFRVVPVNASLARGSGGRLELAVTNNGEETLTDISAKLFADDPLSTTDDEAFIGRLEPGENRTVAFGVSVGGDALAKPYPVTVDFQFEDADGDTRISDAYRVPVAVEPRRRGGGLPLVAVGGFLVVAAAGGYLRYRR